MMLKASAQSGQSVTVENDCGHNQRQATAAWQRFHHSVKLRLKLAASLVAFIASFGLALASDTPQRPPSPEEQRTIGPLHLGMTVQQVRNILGPEELKLDGDDPATELIYVDGEDYVEIRFNSFPPYTFKPEDVKADDISIHQHDMYQHHPYIPKSLGPIMSWKWLGKSLTYPARDRHPIGLSYHYFPKAVDCKGYIGDGSGVTFIGRYVCADFWDRPDFNMGLTYPSAPPWVPRPQVRASPTTRK